MSVLRVTYHRVNDVTYLGQHSGDGRLDRVDVKGGNVGEADAQDGIRQPDDEKTHTHDDRHLLGGQEFKQSATTAKGRSVGWM